MSVNLLMGGVRLGLVAMKQRVVSGLALIGASFAGIGSPVLAVGLQRQNPLHDPGGATRAPTLRDGLGRLVDDPEFAIVEPRFELPQADRSANARTEATRDALLIALPALRPVELRIEPLSGHRGFDTMRFRRATLGWRMTTGSNALGIGMTGSYGVRIARGWRFTPFAALDYNRIDSARIVDVASPNPFVQDNADAGLTATAGATVSHRIRAWPKLRFVGFGAMVAGSDYMPSPRDAASVAARVIQSLGSSAPDSLWYEYGAGADYTLSPAARIGAGVVGTANRTTGDTIAGKVSIRVVM